MLNAEQAAILQALAQTDSSRGLTSDEVRIEAGWPSAYGVDLVLQALVALELVEKRDQTSEFWPSGRVAEAIQLVGGQIRSRARFRATAAGIHLLNGE